MASLRTSTGSSLENPPSIVGWFREIHCVPLELPCCEDRDELVRSRRKRLTHWEPAGQPSGRCFQCTNRAAGVPMLTWVVWLKMSQLFQGARANEIRRSVTCASDTTVQCPCCGQCADAGAPAESVKIKAEGRTPKATRCRWRFEAVRRELLGKSLCGFSAPTASGRSARKQYSPGNGKHQEPRP